MKEISICLIVISVISVIVTVYDKIASKHNPERRVRERTLLLLSALGGGVTMLLTMLVIRHKTLHVKFMLGIPIIILVQLIIIWALVHYGMIVL